MESLRKAIISRERGAALLIVLAFVVLLTGLGVAYLSRATSDRQVAQASFNQSKVDEVTASAMDLIIGDLQQEIVNGSSPTPTATPNISPLPTPTATPFVYPPLAPGNIVPMRNPTPTPGTTPAIPNLIRSSVRSDSILYPGVPSRAGAVNSTQASANGRLLTLPRWNKHYLIPRPAGASPTDTTPIAAFTAPDWVILTRNGPAAFSAWNSSLADPSQSNNSYCVGRYAYAIYDEAGLLDANVVGYPSNTITVQYGPKGVSAFADLTALGMSQNDIDAIVGWRNYFSAGPSGSFPNFNFNAAAATNYVASVLSNTNGFLSVPVPSSTPNNMSRTDQQFTMRQSLIQLVVGSLSSNAVNALQYLGTFSRELNAPSWTPTLNATDMGAPNNGTGNIYAYATNANSSTTINPNLLNVRVVNSFLRADGTCDPQQGNDCAGQPLISRRFPLTRLAGLGPTGIVTTANSTIVNGVPAVATAATIQRDFGLAWDDANKRWLYVGSSGSTVLTAIDRLDQVAAENREPNFFELLKAAILSGSVGMGSGTGNARTFVAAEPKYYDPSNGCSDYQIMQIGANIISQWDSSNIPTFIAFGVDPSGGGLSYELAGIKNLPYLNKLVFKPAWTSNTQFAAWLVPSLWNPHQNAPPSASQDVRIAMTAGTMTGYITSSAASQPSTPINASSTQYMTVDVHSYFGANSATAPSGPKTANPANGSTITQMPNNMGGYYGFNFAFPVNPSITKSNSQTAYPDFGATTGCTFELQVNVGGTWKTYQRWKNCGPNHPLFFQPPTLGNYWNRNDLEDPEFVALDPRTLRFGVWGNDGFDSGVATDYTTGVLTTLDQSVGSPPSTAVYELIPAAVTTLRPNGSMFASSTSPNLYLYANNTDATVHYTDLDLVQRQGDALTPNYTTAMQPTDSTDRPLILAGAFQNGVFQSVAELGHVFRDQPWKTLTFTTAAPIAIPAPTPRSADAGLLDVFTLHESTMDAGKTSLNTKQPLVLQAILGQSTSGGAIKRLAGTNADLISSTQRNNIVTALTNLTSNQPMVNKAELVTRLAADASVTGLGNKEARECVLRAFSDAGQTRTWNLLIDVVAQSGRYPPNANTLAGFVVEGEQHYWVHVAIDRFTGQVIDKQIEIVNE
jgi:hypothetical protein